MNLLNVNKPIIYIPTYEISESNLLKYNARFDRCPNVSNIKNGTDNNLLCWASCAQMCLQSINESKRKCEVVEIGLNKNCCTRSGSVMHGSCNRPISRSEVEEVNYASGYDCTQEHGRISEDDLVDRIDDCQVVEVAVTLGGRLLHTIIVADYNVADDYNYYFIFDPRESGVFKVTYDELCMLYDNEKGWVDTWSYKMF